MEAGPQQLLARLDRIGAQLRDSGHALALIGLGSAGLERERLDAWSDLDFFVIAEPGWKRRYLDDLDWLAAAQPLVWQHHSSGDGGKALMDDGVFCDFSVYEPGELEAVSFAPGRLVWRRDGVDAALARPHHAPPPPTTDEAWIVGEALAALHVGLQRWRRGEKLAAARLVQGQALDRLIELDALRTHPVAGDPFDATRRLEARHPQLADELPRLAPGYAHTPAAALALLEALAARGAVLNEAMVRRIRALAA